MNGHLLAGVAAFFAWALSFTIVGASLGTLALLLGTRQLAGPWLLLVLLVTGGGCSLVAVWAHGRVNRYYAAKNPPLRRSSACREPTGHGSR